MGDAKSGKRAKKNPLYIEMIIAAIKADNSTMGTSKPAIERYLHSKYYTVDLRSSLTTLWRPSEEHMLVIVANPFLKNKCY